MLGWVRLVLVMLVTFVLLNSVGHGICMVYVCVLYLGGFAVRLFIVLCVCCCVWLLFVGFWICCWWAVLLLLVGFGLRPLWLVVIVVLLLAGLLLVYCLS